MGALAVLVGGVVMLASRRIITRHSASVAEAGSRVSDRVVAAVNARVDLVANGRETAFLDGLRADAGRWCDLAMRADRVSALAGRAPILAAALAVAAVVGVDSSLRGEVLATGLARSAIYASAVPPFLAVARWAMQLVKDAVKVRALIEILDAKRSPTGGARGTPLPSLPAPVEWRGATVRYGAVGGGVLALDDVSVLWPTEKALLVVGPNGSGKSTLLRLVLGLFAPSTGSVTVNGVDVLSLDLRAWRARAAYLGQRPYMLDRATVRETLAVMAPASRDADMQRALERLQVWADLAKKIPGDPLSVSVGTLSVGQRQRVALARVLVQDATVIILDEPDANLDSAGVAIVAELVRELSRKRMVVVAAHTPELAAAGDILVQLDMGRVRESTTPPSADRRHDHA
jgi:ATP-binding cassette subfamily C protein CydD/ATP-binding cassette subfamily C protein CydCD